MPRFFCPAPLRTGDVLDLPAGAARHVQVLRLQPGDAITLFNHGPGWEGASPGGEFEARVTLMGRSQVQVEIGAHLGVEREAQRAVHLAVGMPANERMDWLVEKAAELGVASIQPLMTERSVLRLAAERATKKVDHWQSVAIAACEQCGGNRVPVVHAVKTLAQWLAGLNLSDASAPKALLLSLREGTQAKPGFLYEFHYEAKNPKVQGLGFAATRDVVSWLRHSPDSVKATGGPMTHALAIGFSQAGRYLRNHISEGFNRDEQGRRVFDGIHSHIAGVGRVFFNTPFAQPARTNTQHEDHGFPENEFPFSTATLGDPLTGRSGSLFRGDGSDPLLIETNTSTEYWQKGASLLHTDPLGTVDVTLPENSRAYMIAGTQHGGRAGATTDPGPNLNPRNPHNPMPAVRALLVALDAWVVSGKAPPPSRVPTLAAGTLVEPDKTGFPAVPGAAIVRTTNVVAPPGDWVKPVASDKSYRTLVSKVDADGNEVAGIRLPDIAVPLATYTGWNEYKPPYPAGEIADRDGSCLPLPLDKAAREAAGDPRTSIAERYRSGTDYVARVQAVVTQLMADRLLLAEDAERYLDRARKEPRVAP